MFSSSLKLSADNSPLVANSSAYLSNWGAGDCSVSVASASGSAASSSLGCDNFFSNSVYDFAKSSGDLNFSGNHSGRSDWLSCATSCGASGPVSGCVMVIVSAI